MQHHFDIGINSLKITSNTERVLTIARPPWGALTIAVFYILFSIAWYLLALHSEQDSKFFKTFVLVAPLFAFGKPLYRNLKAAFWGEIYQINKARERILKNKMPWLKFKELQALQIRYFYDHDSEKYSYRLSLLCTGKRKFFLDESSNLKYLGYLAEQIALATDIEVITKH